MTAIQFYTANAKKISERCTVLVTSMFVRIEGIWSTNAATYFFKSPYERKAILRVLRDADCIITLDSVEVE